MDDSQWEDIHVVTGALKMFFRELPEPLFPFSFFERFVEAISKYPHTGAAGGASWQRGIIKEKIRKTIIAVMEIIISPMNAPHLSVSCLCF